MSDDHFIIYYDMKLAYKRASLCSIDKIAIITSYTFIKNNQYIEENTQDEMHNFIGFASIEVNVIIFLK